MVFEVAIFHFCHASPGKLDESSDHNFTEEAFTLLALQHDLPLDEELSKKDAEEL
jgi:hypothetical protein